MNYGHLKGRSGRFRPDTLYIQFEKVAKIPLSKLTLRGVFKNIDTLYLSIFVPNRDRSARRAVGEACK